MRNKIIQVIVVMIAVIAIWFMENRNEIFDLEKYMSKNKKKWIDIGFQGTDDPEVYHGGRGMWIIFEKEKPQILTVGRKGLYNFHGIKVLDSQLAAENCIKDDYEVIEKDEGEVFYKHKREELWVVFKLEGDRVETILAITNKTLLDGHGGNDELTWNKIDENQTPWVKN